MSDVPAFSHLLLKWKGKGNISFFLIKPLSFLFSERGMTTRLIFFISFANWIYFQYGYTRVYVCVCFWGFFFFQSVFDYINIYSVKSFLTIKFKIISEEKKCEVIINLLIFSVVILHWFITIDFCYSYVKCCDLLPWSGIKKYFKIAKN